jgi:hypothetical protein
MKLIDLHVHSNRSDGTLSPSELAVCAAKAGLSAFALTDHDTMDGVDEAVQAAAPYHIEVIPGIEFSTDYQGTDIHIVGLSLDPKDDQLQQQIRFFRDERLRRNQKMIRLMADDGIDISAKQLKHSFGDAILTRAHFARYLSDHGYVSDMPEAFRTLLGEGCRYYIPREKVSPFAVTSLIRRHHGIPVLAHPYQYHFSDSQLRELLSLLKESGLIGIEVYYSSYTQQQQNDLLALADEFGLAASGGSDFHGSNKPTISIGSGTGDLQIPYTVLENLREYTYKDSSFLNGTI